MTELVKNDPAEARRFFADKMAFTTGPVELSSNLKQGRHIAVIDLREEKEFRKGHIPGAVNLPRDRWYTCEGLQMGVLNVVYGDTLQWRLPAMAAVEFAAKGYSVMELDGGFDAWKANKLYVATETPDRRPSDRDQGSGIYF